MPSRTINFFIACSFLFLCTNLPAQDYIYDAQRYTTEDGLPNLFASAVTKDKQGFIWGATPDGIYQYDGYEFKEYKITQNESATKRIRQLKVDEQNNLWLFSANTRSPVYPNNQSIVSIDIFNTQTKKVIPFQDYFSSKPPFSSEDVLLSKVIDTKNRLWITTKKGALFLFQDGVFNKIFEKRGVFFQYVTVDATDNIWLGFEQTMIQITKEGKLIEKVALPEQINGIWTANTNEVWLSTGVWEDTTALKIKSHNYTARLWSKPSSGQLSPLDLIKNGVCLLYTSPSPRD